MFAEAIAAILRDHCTPQAVRAIEAGGDPHALWGAVADAGFLELLRPEGPGGAGAALADLHAVVVELGRHAMPLPLADAIGARALVGPEVELPPGMLALAPALVRQPGGGLLAPLVPGGALAEHVLGEQAGRLVLLPCAPARRVRPGIAGSLLATLEWPSADAARPLDGQAEALAPLAAALHAALLAGAMNRVFAMTLRHCNERQQFGRPLGKFQAVQHQLAVMAEQVAAAAMAAQAPFQGGARVPALLPAAMAKARTSEAAPQVANTAHALHGAIGITGEYDLQLYTRRLHEGRLAHGGEVHWNRIVGERLLASGQTLAEFVRLSGA